MDTMSEPPQAAVPWTPRDVLWGLVVFVLWIALFLTLSVLGQELKLPVDGSFIIVFGEAILLLPVWYFTIHKYRVSWAALGLRSFRPWAIGQGCGLMLLSLLFNIIYAGFLALFGLQIQPNIDQLFKQTDFPLTLLFGGAIVAPMVEELFFRGFVFAGLRGRWSWPKAALVSAGLFALAHIVPTAILPILILGLIFAYLYETSGSIWPAILMHTLTNTVALLAAYAIDQGWLPSP